MTEFLNGYLYTTEEIPYDNNKKFTLFDKSGYKYYLSKSNLKCLSRRDGIPARYYNYNLLEILYTDNISEQLEKLKIYKK